MKASSTDHPSHRSGWAKHDDPDPDERRQHPPTRNRRHLVSDQDKPIPRGKDQPDIDHLTDLMNDLKLNFVKYQEDDNRKYNSLKKEIREINLRMYNNRRNELALPGPGAINAVKSQLPPEDSDQESSDLEDDAAAVSAVQYRKDGTLRVCYGCTSPDHDAYRCAKLQRLIDNGLFFSEKLEGTSMLLGTYDEAFSGQTETLDSAAIRLYRDQTGVWHREVRPCKTRVSVPEE